MYAEILGEFCEHLEVVILGPHGEVMGNGGGGDDRVHGTGTTPAFPSGGEKIGQLLRDRLVVGEGDEPLCPSQCVLAKPPQRRIRGASHSNSQFRQRSDRDACVSRRR